MIVRVRYLAQLRNAAGRTTENVEVEEGSTVTTLIAYLGQVRPELQSVLRSPTLLVFVGDEQARAGHLLRPGDEIILMTPIAGGDRAARLR